MAKILGLTITVQDKIILILNIKIAQKKDVMIAPYSSTRLGLAKIIGISPAHISRAGKKLIEKGVVEEIKANVKGFKKRIIAYYLTPNGVRKKNELEKKIGEKKVLFENKDGKVKEIKISEVDQYFGTMTTIFEKIESVSSEGLLKYNVLKETIERTRRYGLKNFVNFTSEIPTIEYFFGRVGELKQLRQWISSKKTKIIAIYGFAGIGKTTLATELVYEYETKTNTFWKNINNGVELRDILNSFSEFLYELNLKMLKNYLDTNQTINLFEVKHIIEEEIREISAIIVFDDCQEAGKKLLRFFKILKEIAKNTDKITVIFVSRTKLPIYDIREIRVDKLVAEMRLGDLDEESAIEFLIARNINKETSKEIFKITKGYPLAINVVHVPVNGKFDRNLIMASTTIFLYNQIYSKLKRKEKSVLKALSVYRSPVSQEALLFGNIEFENLENLMRKSLLNQTISGDYTMHELIKENIYSQLSSKEKKNYHIVAGKFYERVKDDISIRESMYHYLKAGKFEKIFKLLVEYGEVLIKKGHCENLKTIIDEILKKNVPKNYLSKILLINGKVKNLLGEWDDAINYFNSCILEELKNTKTKSKAYREIGFILTERGEWDLALENYKNSLKISEIIDDKDELAEVYRSLGNIYWKKSDYKNSLKYLNKSLEIAKKNENIIEIGKIYVDLGIIQCEKNNHKKAQKYFEESLRILENSDSVVEIGRVFNGLGVVHYCQKNYKKAIEYFEKCVENSKSSGNIRITGFGLLNLGGCYIEINNLKNGVEYCKKALTIFKKLENKRMIASSLLELGRICRLQKDWDKSLRYFKKSLKTYKNINVPYYLAQIYYEIGMLYKDMGEIDNAKIQFNTALKIAKEKNIDYFIEKIEKLI